MVLEEFANVLGPIVTATGSILALAYFPQVYKIWKKKSVEDISLTMYGVAFPCLVLWLLYGLSINNLPLIASNAIAVVASGMIIVLYLKYRRR